MTKIEQIKELLKTIDNPPTDEEMEDFNPADWSGGNFDDAYNLGYSHGECYLAESIRAILE